MLKKDTRKTKYTACRKSIRAMARVKSRKPKSKNKTIKIEEWTGLKDIRPLTLDLRLVLKDIRPLTLDFRLISTIPDICQEFGENKLMKNNGSPSF